MAEVLCNPSRRSFVRAAAWTVPVVAIAAAAPAYALTTQATLGSASLASRYSLNSRRHIAWDLTLTNGALAIKSISITLTYVPTTGNFNFEALEVFNYVQPSVIRDTGWVSTPVPGQAKVTTVHAATLIPARSTTLIHTDFTGSDNSTGTGTIGVSATIVYADNTTSTVSTSAAWSTGTAHTFHP